jgi:hypothetical protein
VGDVAEAVTNVVDDALTDGLDVVNDVLALEMKGSALRYSLGALLM